MSNRAVPKGSGRRTNLVRKPYVLDPKYVKIKGTARKCHRHPKEAAVAFELNKRDRSYKRPVCAGCAA
jgi:hypothetical protein